MDDTTYTWPHRVESSPLAPPPLHHLNGPLRFASLQTVSPVVSSKLLGELISRTEQGWLKAVLLYTTRCFEHLHAVEVRVVFGRFRQGSLLFIKSHSLTFSYRYLIK